jgi:glycine/D-amino acid oxidase-like deaminating enzyme
VMLLSACSGHGFKFAPAIGEAVAESVVEGESRHDLSAFRVARFGDPGD